MYETISITLSPSKPHKTRVYSVKVMPQGRKREYVIQKFTLEEKFSSVVDMKESLSNMLRFSVDSFGYITPGHGLKGKQQWIVQDEDLIEMYNSYKWCQEIMLWCIQPSRDQNKSQLGANPRKTRSSDSHGGNSNAKRGSCSQSLSIVEDIVKQLKEKHGQRYTVEQLSCWAHMYNMGRHGTLDTPPNVPFSLEKVSKYLEQP